MRIEFCVRLLNEGQQLKQPHDATLFVNHVLVDNRTCILQRQVLRRFTNLSWHLGFQSVKSVMFWNSVLESIARPGCFVLPLHI